MSLWGNKDSVYSAGTIAISGTTVTGTGTTFNTAGLINEGDIIIVGAGATYGEAVISSVTNATTIVLSSANGLGTVPAGAAYDISQKPISTLKDSNYSATEIFGVDTTEQSVARDAGSQYRPAHAGWVGITSYTDQHGNTRVKTEVLVAGSTISGDAGDDQQLPDS